MSDQVGIKSWIRIALCVAAGVIIAGVVRGNIAGVIVPLTIAYVAARIVRPTARFLSRACHVSEKVGGAVFAVIICGAAIYGITILSGRLVDQLWRMVEDLPRYADRTLELIGKVYDAVPFKSDRMGRSVLEILEGVLREAAGYIGSAVAEFLGSVVQSFPGMIMATLVSAVGFIYLTSDMDGASQSIESLLPSAHSEKIKSGFKDVSGAVFSYLRAYATIMSVNFILLSVGLTIVGAENPLAVGLIIAFVDALPVLGCGTVLIPWALWSFLSGEMMRGAGLLILLGVIYIVRQFLEPRVIGRMTGVHPFVALACVYIGLKLGGIGGMIVAPIILMCVMQVRRGQGE